ncbi:MAG: hypothetical protein L6420_05735 [Elusimicrobia bacterium]|nr:hypothetical protein [Elusimicrobiota bacterium]
MKLCFIPAIKAGQASVGNYALRNLEDSKDVSPVNEVTRGERPIIEAMLHSRH